MKTRSKVMFIYIFIFFSSLVLSDRIKSDSRNFNEDIGMPNISSGGLAYRRWGGPNPDVAHAITIDSSDNLYLAGYTESYGALGRDVCVVKYDKSGTVQWHKTYGTSDDDEAYAITVDSYGNIYVAGYTQIGYNYCIYLLKLNSSGDLKWDKTWEGDYMSKAFAIALDSQNNIYLGGYKNTDMCLVKFNNSGDIKWYSVPINQTPTYDSGNGIAIDSSDNIYLVGDVGFDSDICLLKYNTSGGILMFQIWDPPRINDIDLGGGIVLDPFNNIYIAGTTWNYETFSYEICLLKYNNLSEYQGYSTWDGVPWEEYQYTEDRATGITMDSSGNIFICGYTYSEDPTGKNYDALLLKFNSTGDFEWSQTWGGEKHDYGYGITLDSQDNIYICGETSSFAEVDNDIDMCVIIYQQSQQSQLIYGYNLFISLGFLGITTVLIIIVSRKFKKERR